MSTATKQQIDDIAATYDLLSHPSGVVEVRAILKERGRHNTAWEGWGDIISGYFDDRESFVRCVSNLDKSKQVKTVYATLNPVVSALMSRASNRLKAAGSKAPTTSDADIVSRQRLLIDCDPFRPAEISSTQAELDAAVAKADEVEQYLLSMGFPRFYAGISGNGAHRIGLIDLPNDEESKQLIGDFLEALNWRFGTVSDDSAEAKRQFNQGVINVGIDTTVFNASRITKVFGTLVRKGDDTTERPHRRAGITYMPDSPQVIPAELLEIVAQEYRDHKQVAAKQQAKPAIIANGYAHKLPTGENWCESVESVEEWFKDRNVTLGARETYTDHGYEYKWRVDCLTSSEHKDGAFICWGANKGLGYTCHHSSCKGKSWADARDIIDPGRKTVGATNTGLGTTPSASINAGKGGADVAFVAGMLQATIATGHDIDDLKPMISRLSDKERRDQSITDELSKIMKGSAAINKWLDSCGHHGASEADRWIAALRGFNIEFSLNRLEDEVEIDGERLEDVTRSRIYLDMKIHGAPKTYVDDAINVLAAEKSYHPIVDYLNNLKWDGNNHIMALMSCLHGNSQKVTYNGGRQMQLHHALIYRWLLGCVARAYESQELKAFKHQTPMLVFVGAQNVGKSSLIRWLVSGVGYQFHQEGQVRPDSTEDKRSMVIKWIWEVSELGATLRKSDREAMKSFITQERQTYRKPYGKAIITRPTLCNLAGSINSETGFLDDPTGNRRFLPVELTKIDWTYKGKVDVDQLWAQLVHLYRNGETPELAPVEKAALDTIHKEHEVENPLQTYVQMYFSVQPGVEKLRCFTAEIIQRLQEFDIKLSNSTKVAGREINDALVPLGLERKLLSIDGVKGWGWVGIAPNAKVPPKYQKRVPGDPESVIKPVNEQWTPEGLAAAQAEMESVTSVTSK